MRKSWIFLLAGTLACAAPVWAGSSEGKGAPAGKKDAGKPAAAPAKAPAAAKAGKSVEPANAAVAAELAQLQKLIQEQSKQLAAQQKQIEALQHDISARTTVSRATTAPAAAVAIVPAPASVTTATAAPATTGTVAPLAVETSPTTAGSAAPAKTVAVSKPAAANAAGQMPRKLPEDIELAGGKIKLGFTMYGQWGEYFKTGFGPQFVTQVNPPGPGNDNYNSFDITRSYINFFYSPNDKYTLRLTPNIFRFVGNVPNQKIGQFGAAGATPNGSLTVRIKYAYVDFNKLFANSPSFSGDKLTIGQQTNPLIDWEEALYGYRFTSLVPWNYLSLSSTHAGVKLHGPIKVNGKQYLDYEVGAFDSGSFHNYELASEKQVMARLSYYPLSFTGRFDGWGLTGFVDYGYGNNTPDTPNFPLYRIAALMHYTNKTFGIAGEFDYGKNAFGVGNLFSATGPADSFGLGPTPYAGLANEAKSILALGAKQQGFDFFGHVNIPHSPFSIFGLYEYFQPNINVSKDPLDFERIVAGIAYKYNGHLRFALDSQNLIYTQSQFTFNGIPNAVPTNTNALFVNVEVNY
jgi:hypothetical protein